MNSLLFTSRHMSYIAGMNKALGFTVLAGIAGVCIGAGVAHMAHVSMRSRHSAPPPAVPYTPSVRPIHQAPDLVSVRAESTTVVTNTVIVTNGIDVRALEKEITALAQQLEQRTLDLNSLQPSVGQAGDTRPPRETYREREERMKKEEPERYAEMQTQREEFRSRMASVVADRAQFLEDLDTSAMSEDEKLAHNELLQRIAGTWQTIDQLQSGQVAPDGNTRHELHEQFNRIRELYDVERDYVLRQVGAELGFDDAQSVNFSAYMKKVYDMTSPQLPRGMFGRGGGPGRDGSSPPPPPATP